MKTNEIIDSIRQAEADTDNWYASRTVGIYDLYGDLSDALEEDCIEGITVTEPKGGKLCIKCDDGTVYVTRGIGELAYAIVPKQTYTDVPVRYPSNRMTHYERRRAAVYATGNRWAIENWNATH